MDENEARIVEAALNLIRGAYDESLHDKNLTDEERQGFDKDLRTVDQMIQDKVWEK